MTITIKEADFSVNAQCDDVVYLLNEYAKDPMGGAEPLADAVKKSLTQEMAKLDYVFSILCYVDNKPAGLVNCIQGFSTFACKPVINIHDVIVLEAYRGRGLTADMFSFVEQIAEQRGACKLTLEVLEGNEVAQRAYIKAGFKGYELDPKMGKALFWEKKLK